MMERKRRKTTWTGSYQISRWWLLRASFSTSFSRCSQFHRMSLLIRSARPSCAIAPVIRLSNCSRETSPNSSNFRQPSTTLVMTGVAATPRAASASSLNCQKWSSWRGWPAAQRSRTSWRMAAVCAGFLLARTGQFWAKLAKSRERLWWLLWLQVMSYLSLWLWRVRNSSSVCSSARLTPPYFLWGFSIVASFAIIARYSLPSRRLRSRYPRMRKLQAVGNSRSTARSVGISCGLNLLEESRTLERHSSSSSACSTISFLPASSTCGCSSIICRTTFSTKWCLSPSRKVSLRDLSCSSSSIWQLLTVLRRVSRGVMRRMRVEKQRWAMWVMGRQWWSSRAQSMSRLQLFFSQISIRRSSSSRCSMSALAEAGGRQYFCTTCRASSSCPLASSSPISSSSSCLRETDRKWCGRQGSRSSSSSSTSLRMCSSTTRMNLAVNSPISCVLIIFLNTFSRLTVMLLSAMSFRLPTFSIIRSQIPPNSNSSRYGCVLCFRSWSRARLFVQAVQTRLPRLVGACSVPAIRDFLRMEALRSVSSKRTVGSRKERGWEADWVCLGLGCWEGWAEGSAEVGLGRRECSRYLSLLQVWPARRCENLKLRF